MGISEKLILPILFAFIIFAGILHFYWAPLQVEHARKTFVDQTRREFVALESGLIRNLLTRDYSALFSTLDSQSRLHKNDWFHLSLYNENNKKIYPLYSEQEKNPDPNFRISYRHELRIDTDLIGYITLQLNWRDEYNSTKQRILQLEFILIATVFVLYLLLLIWQHRVIKLPIKKLQSVSEKMARGDFSVSLPDTGKDEIGKLTASFDYMRREIMSYEQSLRTAHEETKKALSVIASKNTELEKEISERKKVETQLKNMAMYDSLTGLPNRRMLVHESGKLLAAARRNRKNAVFLFLDLDGFKKINDEHGHEAGDAVLTEIANRLHDSVREIDVVGRFGGDEFVVVLPECNTQNELEMICARIIDEVRKPVTAIKTSIVIGTSVGIAEYPGDASDSSELISLADKAMYVAKQSGGNQCAYASALSGHKHQTTS